MIYTIDNRFNIEDDPDMVEVISEEEIEALYVSINVVANGSNTIDFDVDDIENEQHQ